MVQNNSKYILDYILIAPLIKVFRTNIAISLNVSWNKNLHDDPLFLFHFWLIYVHIFHFGKYQELFNSRSKMAHLPLKPIFHQNAKYLALGVGVGQCPRRQTFALGIPTCWYRRQSVEYRWRWAFWRWPCTFHVHFMYISCTFHVVCATFFRVGNAKISRRKGRFQWNTGFRIRRYTTQ